MAQFDIEIRHPHHASDNELELVHVKSIAEVSTAFDAMHWFNLQLLLLQLQGRQAYFMVTNPESSQSIKISLNELSTSDSLEFVLQSDIEVISEQREVFGLFKRKTKDYVEFKQLNLRKAHEYLDRFLNGQLDALKQQYLNGDAEVACSS